MLQFACSVAILEPLTLDSQVSAAFLHDFGSLHLEKGGWGCAGWNSWVILGIAEGGRTRLCIMMRCFDTCR